MLPAPERANSFEYAPSPRSTKPCYIPFLWAYNCKFIRNQLTGSKYEQTAANKTKKNEIRCIFNGKIYLKLSKLEEKVSNQVQLQEPGPSHGNDEIGPEQMREIQEAVQAIPPMGECIDWSRLRWERLW